MDEDYQKKIIIVLLVFVGVLFLTLIVVFLIIILNSSEEEIYQENNNLNTGYEGVDVVSCSSTLDYSLECEKLFKNGDMVQVCNSLSENRDNCFLHASNIQKNSGYCNYIMDGNLKNQCSMITYTPLGEPL